MVLLRHSVMSIMMMAVVNTGVCSFNLHNNVVVGRPRIPVYYTTQKPLIQLGMSIVPPTNPLIKEGEGEGAVTVLASPPPEEQASTNSSLVKETSESNSPPISLWMARAILLLVAIVWGTNFATVKYLETLCFHPPCNHPPSEFAFARFGVAGLASLPFLIGQPSEDFLAGLECGIWIAVGYFTQGTLRGIVSYKIVYIPFLAYFYLLQYILLLLLFEPYRLFVCFFKY
jgi:hypothetical protein